MNQLENWRCCSINTDPNRNSSIHICFVSMYGEGRILLITIYGLLEYRYFMQYQHNYNRISKVPNASGFELLTIRIQTEEIKNNTLPFVVLNVVKK